MSSGKQPNLPAKPAQGVTSSLYSVKPPAAVTGKGHDFRYSAKQKGPSTALKSHHLGKSSFMSVRDMPHELFMDGLSVVSANTSVGSLIGEDDRYVKELYSDFVKKLQEQENEDEPPKITEGRRKYKESKAVDRVQRHMSRTSLIPSRPSIAVSHKSSVDAGSKTIDIDAMLAEDEKDELGSDAGSQPGRQDADHYLESVIPREEKLLTYRLIPWRCVFQTWVRALTDELVQLKGHPNALIPLELFMTRARDACDVAMNQQREGTGSTSNSPRRRKSKVVFQATGVDLSGPMVAYSRRIPHPITVASAVYAFDVYLIPLMGQYQEVVRRALHELVLALYVEAPAITGRLIRRKSSGKLVPGKPDVKGMAAKALQVDNHTLLSDHLEATVYLRPMFIQRFHELKAMFYVLRDFHRRQSVVMERQENILQRSLLKMSKQTAKRLVGAWHIYTQRVKKLRQRYRKVFLSLSDTATVAVTLRNWKFAARILKAKQRGKKEDDLKKEEPAITQHIKTMRLRQELTALIQQKQVKVQILEDGLNINRRLQEKRNELENRRKTAAERMRKIGNLWLTVVEDLLPPPSQKKVRMSFDRPVQQQDQYTCFETEEELRQELLQWLVELSKRDEAISGKNLTKLLLGTVASLLLANSSNAGSSVTSAASAAATVVISGVLSRSTHLLPVLRVALTIVSPPPHWVATAVSPSLSPSSSMGLGSPSGPATRAGGFVAFGEVVNEPLSPSLEDSMHSPGNTADEEDVADFVPELSMKADNASFRRSDTNLAAKHAAMSIAIKRQMEQMESEEELMNVDSNQNSRRQSLSMSFNQIPTTASRRQSLAAPGDPEDEEAARFLKRKNTLKSLQGSFKKDKNNGSPMISLNDNEVDRSKQLEVVLKPLADVSDATSFSQFIVTLANRIVKVGGVPFSKILPQSYVHRLVRPVDEWRMLSLAYLYLSQWGNNSGSFRLLPNADTRQQQQQQQRSTTGSTAWAGKPQRFSSFARKQTNSGAAGGSKDDAPPFQSSSELKGMWDDRIRKRRYCGDDQRAMRANRMHESYVSQIVDNALNGGELSRECARVYHLYSAACPTVSNNRVITSDFLATKLRIVFGDKTSWRQANSNRRVTSPKEMEEYLKTMSVATRMEMFELCEKLIAAADDTDHFFASIGAHEVQEAFESSLADLSVIFSLYSSGEPPEHYIPLEGWLQLTHPFLDSCFTSTVAAETYHKIYERNSSSAPFRLEGGDTLLGKTKVLSGSNDSVIAGKHQHGSTGDLPGLNMDSFCQALSVVVAFKIPNPFTPLEAKIPLFINNWLVPMAGTKVKGRLSGTGTGDARRESSATFMPLQY